MIGIPCQTTLFCDFDGPIVDVSERYYATYQRSLEAIGATESSGGCNRLTKAQFWCLKQQRIPDFEIALRSGIPQNNVERFLHIVRTIVNQADLLHKDALQPGVRWALELMHSQGVRLILVTLRQQEQVHAFLEQHQLGHLFASVWGASSTAAAYQNNAHYKTELLAQAQAEDRRRYGPAQCAWMVGDTEADILAGQTNRVGTIALTCGIRSRAYLSQYSPDHICNDLVSVTHSIVHGLQSPASALR